MYYPCRYLQLLEKELQRTSERHVRLRLQCTQEVCVAKSKCVNKEAMQRSKPSVSKTSNLDKLQDKEVIQMMPKIML